MRSHVLSVISVFAACAAQAVQWDFTGGMPPDVKPRPCAAFDGRGLVPTQITNRSAGAGVVAVDGRTVRFAPAFEADETKKAAEHWNLWRPVIGRIHVGKDGRRTVKVLSREPASDLSSVCEFR